MVDPCVLLSSPPLSGASISTQVVRRNPNQPPNGFLPLGQDQNSKAEILGLSKEGFKLVQLQNVQNSVFAESKAARKSPRRISSFNERVLVDVQEVCSDSILFSFGITEQCVQHEKILQFLSSGYKKGLNVTLLSELMGIQRLAVDVHGWSSFSSDDDFGLYTYGTDELGEARQHVTQFQQIFQTSYSLETSDCGSSYYRSKKSTVQCNQTNGDVVGWLEPEAHVFLETEAHVLLFPVTRIVSQLLHSKNNEFHLTNNCIKPNKQFGIVPHFENSMPGVSVIEREEKAHAKLYGTGSFAPKMVPTSTATQNVKSSVLSPERHKLKHHTRKTNKRLAKKGRDIFKKSQFHLYECMLSVLFTNNSATSSVLELTKTRSKEFMTLLNQIAVALAGSGLATVLFVASKMLAVNALFDSSKFFNILFGFGLIWLSCAVQNLREVFLSLTEPQYTVRLKESQIVSKVKRELNGVTFKAFALMAFSMLRYVSI
eukprot:Gb_03323 [translate_table: standard]